jgi:glutamate racemase
MPASLDRHQAIGIFDSGIGGLTVAKAISDLLPDEQLIYFGDTAHMPYGDRSPDSIRYYCLRIAKFLLEQNCKMIVIACNTASSVAYQVLLDFFKKNSLFVNVVDPLVEETARQHFHRVGVIATKATISSRVYELKLQDRMPDLEVSSLATPLLAPMIESGYFHDKISKTVIEDYLSTEELANLDALLLACTHYPLIKSDIDAFYNGQVKILDSTIVTAQSVKKTLESRDLLSDARQAPNRFYVSELTQSFKETTSIFYEEEIQLIHQPIWQ